MLTRDGIHAEVIHIATIKPLDSNAILKSAQKTRHVITAEEAQITGGLGGAVAELLAENLPTPMKRIGVKDRFGESGKPDELMKHFGLTAHHIAMAAHHILIDHTNHKH
jgi:transketolase